MWLLGIWADLSSLKFFSKATGRPCFVIPVTSGLGIVPATWVLGYSASKAALHSFTMGLRAQLRDTNVHVMEIIPPWVDNLTPSLGHLIIDRLTSHRRLVESELHDGEYLRKVVRNTLSFLAAEGTTEKLRNLWMPLDKYIEVTMQGLKAGDAIISTRGSLDWYDKYDRGKEDLIVQMQAGREKW